MKSQILNKIENELEIFNSEPQIVYLLTRIGKIIELDNKQSIYPVLHFYRNWSVHAVIDRELKPEIKLILVNFINSPADRDTFLFHNKLISELDKFCSEYSLPTLNRKKIDEFIFLLGKVLSDTSVKLKLENSVYNVELSEPRTVGESGVYKIDVVINVPLLK